MKWPDSKNDNHFDFRIYGSEVMDQNTVLIKAPENRT